MADVLEGSLAQYDRAELEATYRHLCARDPKDRVEIIDGRVVVSPVPTANHERIVAKLTRILIPALDERDWDFSANMGLYLGAQRDRYRPDLTIYPYDPPLWGDDHVYGDGTLLVVEVTSRNSITDDHQIKPRACAAAGVPLYLVIDAFSNFLRLLSKPNSKTEKYEQQIEVPFGGALELPEPWELAIDTSGFGQRVGE